MQELNADTPKKQGDLSTADQIVTLLGRVVDVLESINQRLADMELGIGRQKL